MKRLNKILLIFFAVSFLTLYWGWRFIHSEKFSNEASIKVSKILTEKFGAQLSFTGVDFSLIPLSTTFKNVKLVKKDPVLFDVQINSEELEVSFTYASFISNELEVDEVELRNGGVKLFAHRTNDDEIIFKKLNTREVFGKYVAFLKQLPVRLNAIVLKEINLEIDKSKLRVNEVKISPHRLSARMKVSLSNIYSEYQYPNLPPIAFSKIEGLLILKKDEWKVERLKIEKNINSLDIRGVAYNENGELHLDSTGKLELNVENLLKEFKSSPSQFRTIKGELKGRFEIKGVVDNPDGKIDFIATNSDTDWIKLETVKAIIEKKKNNISLLKFSARNGSEEYILKKPETFYDLERGRFADFRFSLRLKNALTNTFLYSAKNSLHAFKGIFTGDVDVALFSDKATFTIGNQASVKEFRLKSTDERSDILNNSGFLIENTQVILNHDFSVEIDAKISMANTLIKAKGKISDKEINIKTSDSKIDLKALGPIAGLSILGSGPVDLKVSGPLNNVVFDLDVDWNNFSVVDLNLGRVKSKFTFNLEDLEIDIESLKGSFNKTNYLVSGRLGFDIENEGIDLKINVLGSTFSDAKKMLHLVFKNIKIPVDPEFNFEATYNISGGFNLDKLKVTGAIRGTDLKLTGEEAEKIALSFSLNNSFLNFKQIKINKSRGELNANVTINLKNNFIELSGATQGFRMLDLNFYRRLSLEYDGDLLVDFSGSGPIDDFSSRFKVRLINAFIGNAPASSSSAIFYVNTNDIITNASLLGGRFKLDSLVNFKTNIAAIKSSLETDDLKELLGFFSVHNMTDKGLEGKIKAQLNTQISLGTLGVRKFLFDIEQLSLKKGEISLVIDPKYSSIQVDDGIVRSWDVRMNDGNDFFQSKGYNISNGVIGVEHKFSLKSSLLELLSSFIEKATGKVQGNSLVVFDKKINIKNFNLNGDGHSIKIKGLPGFITNLDFNIVKKIDAFEILRMTGNYGGGEFKIGGKIFFDDLYPQVSINYQVDRSTIPLFKRSSILVNSSGYLSGTDLPYKLNGKVSLMHGEILDDLTELMKGSKVNIDEYKKYLPERNLLVNRQFLDLNLNFETLNPIAIKNNMLEVYAKGNGQATGDLLSPEISTRIETVANISKFKFKGHDFVLNQGYVEIRDRGKNRVSDLKFTGAAKINEYDMRLDLSGNISDVKIELSSEPALSNEDLLSLLTLGVTSDMSKNLEAGERRFVTTVGIGTLLVDQLKINEDLNSSLGLKLSVLPEFKEDETTLIQGKSAVSEGTASRLKSATKIKLNKKINNRVDVSLSSTIGGSLEQKQEMNINLNINKNFSLEGVYEIKPTEDENTSSPNSLGADLKWRKSF